jgi:hypothetical protein
VTRIRGNVERTTNVQLGFRCGLCKESFRFWNCYDVKKYKTDFGREEDVSSLKTSHLGRLCYDHPDGESDVNVDLCDTCFYKLRDIVKGMGGIIENDG